jgi:hypothetical protein
MRAHAADSLLNLTHRLTDPIPRLWNLAHFEIGIAQSIIPIRAVSVIYSTFQFESGRRNIGDNPLGVPLGICLSAEGRSAKNEVWILLVSSRDVGGEHGHDIWIGGKAAKIAYGEVVGSMEGELESVARRELGEGGRIEAAGRFVGTGLLLRRRRRAIWFLCFRARAIGDWLAVHLIN